MTEKDSFIELGQNWLKGQPINGIELNGKLFDFTKNKKQSLFLNDLKSRYCLYSGGFACGKSLVLYIKLILFCVCFPNNRVLLGRKTLSDLERSVLPDLFELMPSKWYKHKIKAGTIDFYNKSQIILFGLEKEGVDDIKGAEQKIKSLNLGAYFIDQLEEVEYDVFNILNSRLRRDVGFQQGNMTCNPANFWAHKYFKGKEWDGKKLGNVCLVEGSMLDNRENLSKEYLEDQLSRDENYVKRYVYGDWSMGLLLKGNVFASEYINRFIIKSPIKIEEDCEIYEQPIPQMKYQMGVDPSEGSVDPASITVVSAEGKKVAKYNGYVTIPGFIMKIKSLYYKYDKPLIIPETNAGGQAVLMGIRDLNVYKRIQYDYKDKKETEKLGWHTSHQSKQALISHFQDLLRVNFPQIYDEKTIEEFKTFIWTDSAQHKGAGAAKSFHDDDVMSTMLAYWDLKPTFQKRKPLEIHRPPTFKRRFEYR